VPHCSAATWAGESAKCCGQLRCTHRPGPCQCSSCTGWCLLHHCSGALALLSWRGDRLQRLHTHRWWLLLLLLLLCARILLLLLLQHRVRLQRLQLLRLQLQRLQLCCLML
jgi:hypothetical protein